jgi:hypothetical protein
MFTICINVKKAVPPKKNNNNSLVFVMQEQCVFCEVIIMALQPVVGPWPLFEFLDPIHSRYDSSDGGSARRKAYTYSQNNTNK